MEVAYRNVVSCRLSWLVAHFHIFRLFMKENFDAILLWPLDKMVQNWIVYRFTTHNFRVRLSFSQIIKIFHRDSLKPQFTDGFSDNDLYAQNEVLQGQQFVALIFQFSK